MWRKSKLQFSLEVVGFVISFVSVNTLLRCYYLTYAIHGIVKAHYIRSMEESVFLYAVLNVLRYRHLHVRLGNKIHDSFCVIIVVKDVHMIFPFPVRMESNKTV